MESNNRRLEFELRKARQEASSSRMELHKATGYLQSILQNSNDMIFATDVDGVLISFSKGGEKVLGFSWEEVAGRPIKLFAEDPESFAHFMAASQQEGSAVRLDVPFRNKGGDTVYCNVSLINLTNREGNRVGTVGVCHDVTQWRNIQEELALVDRLAEIGRIAAGVAHEINNPLAVIGEASGWASSVIAESKGLSPEDREELERAAKEITEQTKRCRSITHQLLNFARGSSPAKTEFDIHELVKETISFLRPDLKNMPIDIEFKFASVPLLVSSDRKLLGQALLNVITNAIHAVRMADREKGHVVITTKKVNSDVEIDVEDNGIGIGEEDQKKIFDLFYTTKKPGEGTGLGLPICQNILRKLGGEITFASRPGIGSTFTINLPVS